MRRITVACLAALALVVGAVAPAGAQIPDVPELGFEIEPLEGAVGSTVFGQVDVDDVEANCITDITDFVGQFVDPENPLGGSTPYLELVIEILDEVFAGNPDLQTPEGFAYAVMLFFPIGLALNLPANGGDGELVQGAVDATMIQAFADLETASPIEPLGNFSSQTGEGQVDVPDLPAGMHPVIATCVGLDQEALTLDAMLAALNAGAAWVSENMELPYPDNPLGPEFAEAASSVAPTMLFELVEPLALGFQFYCVWDADGVCPVDDVPVVPVDPADERPAEAVATAPRFTG